MCVCVLTCHGDEILSGLQPVVGAVCLRLHMLVSDGILRRKPQVGARCQHTHARKRWVHHVQVCEHNVSRG